MADDRFDERLRQAAQDYHRPPATVREELWHRIAAARAARKRQVIVVRSTLRWGVGIAAVLALGVAIGRWSARRGESPNSPTVIAGSDQASTLAYRVAAAQYLTRTEALLTGFRAESRSPSVPAVQFSRQARDLRSEEHTSELQSRLHLVCRLLLEKKKNKRRIMLQRMLKQNTLMRDKTTAASSTADY